MDLRRTLVWSARVIAFLVMMLTANAASAANALTSLVITGMSPAFDPTVTQYTVPLPANCSVAVAATLGTPTDLLYIQRSEELRVRKECRSRWSPDH